MTAPDTTSADDALSNLMGAALGTPVTSQPDSLPAPVYGSPAEVVNRIEQYIDRYGRENSASLLLYEAMKALCAPASAPAAGDVWDTESHFSDQSGGHLAK